MAVTVLPAVPLGTGRASGASPSLLVTLTGSELESHSPDPGNLRKFPLQVFSTFLSSLPHFSLVVFWFWILFGWFLWGFFFRIMRYRGAWNTEVHTFRVFKFGLIHLLFSFVIGFGGFGFYCCFSVCLMTLSVAVLEQILISDSFAIVKTPTLKQAAREAVWHLHVMLGILTNTSGHWSPGSEASPHPQSTTEQFTTTHLTE